MLKNGKCVVSYIDVIKLVFEKVNDEGEINGFYYCKDWFKFK